MQIKYSVLWLKVHCALAYNTLTIVNVFEQDCNSKRETNLFELQFQGDIAHSNKHYRVHHASVYYYISLFATKCLYLHCKQFLLFTWHPPRFCRTFTTYNSGIFIKRNSSFSFEHFSRMKFDTMIKRTINILQNDIRFV